MNNLKHILSINVPRHAPSSTALSSCHGQHTGVYLKSRQLRTQLLTTGSLPTAKSHGTGVKHSRQLRQDSMRLIAKGSKTICKQRSKTKSSATSLKKLSVNKKLSNIAGTVRHCSTYQNVKLNSGRIGEQRAPHNVVITNNSARNINRNSSFATSVEKHPRTYAEMIADYSEALYKRPAAGTRNDGVYLGGVIRKSPFSTLSTSPLSKKITEYAGIPIEVRETDPLLLADALKSYGRSIRRDNVDLAKRRDIQNRDMCIAETAGKSADEVLAAENDDQSYAKLMADCSESMHDIYLASVSKSGLISNKNVGRNFLQSSAAPTKKARSMANAQDISRQAIPVIATMMEKLTKRRNADKIDLFEEEEERDDSIPRKYNYLQSSNWASDSSQHYGDVTRTSSPSARKHSTQVTTSGSSGSISGQPQVELRMVPSEKESVVSINVDSAASGLFNPATSKQLSVVVQSDQKKDLPAAEKQWSASTTLRRSAQNTSQRDDFGPMRISISEDSAPVKLIEFSINGKPVSELKSITARTESLDVVSSLDKIEIRIPFAKDETRTDTGRKNSELLKRSDSVNAEQILNVQINANFQNQSAKSSAERSYKSQTTNATPSPSSSSQIPKTRHIFKDSAKGRPSIFSDDDMQQYGSSDRFDKSDKTIKRNEYRDTGDFDLKQRIETAKKSSTEKTITRLSSKKKTSDLEAARTSTKKIMNPARSPENKYESEPSDPRVPSKMIPWWSSSDCFNKIRKKDEDRKSITPSNLNEKKTTPNLRQNLVAESSLSRPQETSNSSKTSTKKVHPIDNATANNLSDVISRFDSLEQRGATKPSAQYSHLFRLKPNRESQDDIPRITRNDSKIENKQPSTVEKGNRYVPEVERTKPVILSSSETMNTQSERDASIKSDACVEKIHVSPKQLKASDNVQDLPPKRNREKERDHSPKHTKSVEAGSHTRSKIKNILDAIKPIEKTKDGTLIDYGLKVPSRKPIVKLYSRVKEIPNAIIKPKEETPTKTSTKMAPNKEQIDKETPVKQRQSKKTGKTNISGKKENLIAKGTEVKKENTNDAKNIKQIDRNSISSSTNSKDSSKPTDTVKKEEQLEDPIILQDSARQHLKLSELSKDRASNLTNMRTSSGTAQKLEKLDKMSSEGPKQNILKILSDVKNPGETKIPQSIKPSSKSLKSQDNPHPLKESIDKKTIHQKKLPLENTKEIKPVNTDKVSSSKTKSNFASKIKNCAVTNISTDKNAATMPIAHQSTEKMDKKAAVAGATIKIVTRNPPSKDSSSKDLEGNRKSKSGKDKEDPSGSADYPKKSGSAGSKSAASKTHMKSGLQSNYNCNRTKKWLLMDSSYADFDRKDDTTPNSWPAGKLRNPNNVDGALENYAPNANGRSGRWSEMDRPEKSMLYSAWLQEFKNDMNNNQKLF